MLVNPGFDVLLYSLRSDGDDVAVIGFDDIAEATIVRPALTTIAQEPADIGRKLATCLFERIGDLAMPRRILESPSHLIVRDSA